MDQTTCTVDAVRSVGPDAVAVDIETPAEFSAQPGQFVKLTFDLSAHYADSKLASLADEGDIDPAQLEASGPVEVSRFYTISSPRVGETFETTVGIDPEGTVGPIIADLAAGDEVTLSGPFGNDYYEGEDPVVVLAGGPGIGPAVGIAERAIEDDHAVALVYRDDEPMHTDRLDDLQAAGCDVTLIDDAEPLTDPVATALDALGTDSQVFVYGFAAFIDAATTAIEAAGGDAEQAKLENFG
jgi:3-phenylpropionate/trans-cinnamate dioxygenase ferredoxin reductase subunit